MICHDPGHGHNGDPGTSHGEIVERELVLSIATDIAAGIPWCDHRLLRHAADGPSYADRARAAVMCGAKLVLCHHVNAYSDSTAHGLITFYDPSDPVGRAVAETISRSAPAKLLRPLTGIFPALTTDWTRDARSVLEHYRELGLPAVLIEWGFATNSGDAASLLDPNIRPQIVCAAANGIARAMELCHIPHDRLFCHV